MSDLAGNTDAPDLLVTAFEIVSESGWRGFTRLDLAARAGVPLSDAYAAFPDSTSLLRSLSAHLDRSMLTTDADELQPLSPRERLFELIMRRFDAMIPFRSGLRALSREAPFSPSAACVIAVNLERTSVWLVEASGAGLSGLRAAAAAKAVTLLYLRVFQIWLDDETSDLANTLAELDKRLQQLEFIAKRVAAGGASGAPPADDEPDMTGAATGVT